MIGALRKCILVFFFLRLFRNKQARKQARKNEQTGRERVATMGRNPSVYQDRDRDQLEY